MSGSVSSSVVFGVGGFPVQTPSGCLLGIETQSRDDVRNEFGIENLEAE